MVKHDFMEAFNKGLARQGKSDLTRHGYQADLRDYATWFRQTYGEPFKPDKMAYDVFSSLTSGPADAQAVAQTCGCSPTGMRLLTS